LLPIEVNEIKDAIRKSFQKDKDDLEGKSFENKVRVHIHRENLVDSEVPLKDVGNDGPTQDASEISKEEYQESSTCIAENPEESTEINSNLEMANIMRCRKQEVTSEQDPLQAKIRVGKITRTAIFKNEVPDIKVVERIRNILLENFYRIENENVSKVQPEEMIELSNLSDSKILKQYGYPYMVLYYKVGSINLANYLTP